MSDTTHKHYAIVIGEHHTFHRGYGGQIPDADRDETADGVRHFAIEDFQETNPGEKVLGDVVFVDITDDELDFLVNLCKTKMDYGVKYCAVRDDPKKAIPPKGIVC
jgi:hypothetical protein